MDNDDGECFGKNGDQTFKIDGENIRNVCIIAHVDHGKTCLADCIISSNGVISARMAGKLRYMDSREDEQLRGITMKTSSISLIYGKTLVNLLDSPGHVDFSGEVSSALLLSDIAFLVIDAVEGVCSQTEFYLRQAISLGLRIVLVFNKIDRLAVELKQTPDCAFAHIRCLIEQVNSCISQIISGLMVEQENWQTVERTEQSLYFSPEKNNVIFASALHGYGFRLLDFAKIWSEKTEISESEILANLFTDSYLSKGKIKNGAQSNSKRSLFEQFVLQPLWELHKHGLMDDNLDALKVMAGKLKVTIRSKRASEAFDELMRGWLPLARACFRAAESLPPSNVTYLIPERLKSLSLFEEHPLYAAVRQCDSNAITILLIAKILHLDESVIAMCRVLSGTLRPGDQFYAIGKKMSTSDESYSSQTKIISVYMLMGRDKMPITRAPAGTVCGIEFKEQLATCTLCSEPVNMGLQFIRNYEEPLVRVSVEPVGGLDELDKLKKALKQLSVLDSNVGIIEQENGELALLAAGEVHLQKCLKDLQDMGQENVKVSEPSVAFLETIIPMPGTSICRTQVDCTLKNGLVKIKLRAAPLPNGFVEILKKNLIGLRDIRESGPMTSAVKRLHEALLEDGVKQLKEMKGTHWSRLRVEQLRTMINRIWAFGPPRARYNVLFNAIEDYDRPSIWTDESGRYRNYEQTLITGFDLSMSTGQLCDEPMWGTAIIIDEWTLEQTDDPAIAGLMISSMKQLCRKAQKKYPIRLMAAMYKCIVQTNSLALGKVHSVLSQRRAKVLSEDINQSSGLFVVEAYMPVIESFSFCDQLRKKTSGMASGQLEFSHWEVIDEDPFWEPTTEEEVELYGRKGDALNRARIYVDAIRKRKGLLIDELIVVNAEKQRTLKKNK